MSEYTSCRLECVECELPMMASDLGNRHGLMHLEAEQSSQNAMREKGISSLLIQTPLSPYGRTHCTRFPHFHPFCVLLQPTDKTSHLSLQLSNPIPKLDRKLLSRFELQQLQLRLSVQRTHEIHVPIHWSFASHSAEFKALLDGCVENHAVRAIGAHDQSCF